MAKCGSFEDQQKTQMNTALYAGHTDNRAPAGLAPLLGGQAGGGLAENTMAHVQFEERQAAVESTAAQMVWNLTVRAESEALKVIGENHSVSSQALMPWIQRRRGIRSEKKKKEKKTEEAIPPVTFSPFLCFESAEKGKGGGRWRCSDKTEHTETR